MSAVQFSVNVILPETSENYFFRIVGFRNSRGIVYTINYRRASSLGLQNSAGAIKVGWRENIQRPKA